MNSCDYFLFPQAIERNSFTINCKSSFHKASLVECEKWNAKKKNAREKVRKGNVKKDCN